MPPRLHRSGSRRQPICLFAAVLGSLLATAVSAASPVPRTDVRGITVSTHTSNQGWDNDEIGPTFADVAEVGANWVAIHPYARIAEDGSVTWREAGQPDAPGYVRRPIAEAHRRGLKILIKPHIGYWGTRFSWRGDIEFATEEQWQRFFVDYEAWIARLAAASTDADGFVVGTELDRTLHREDDWRRVIARVRRESGVPLTYAANWTDYQRVPFWDALDVVGIQAYFPIARSEHPGDAELAAGWQRLLADLVGFSDRTRKRIVFTELGYNRAWRAASAPWEWRTDGPEAEALQGRCLAAALRAIESEPRILGAFLWKWFPRPRSVGRDFQMAAPAIQQVIREHWRPTPAASD